MWDSHGPTLFQIKPNPYQIDFNLRPGSDSTRPESTGTDQTRLNQTRLGSDSTSPYYQKAKYLFFWSILFIINWFLTVSGCKALNIFGKWLWSLNVPTIGIDNLKYHWSVVNFAIDNWTKAQAQLDIEDIEWRLLRMSSSNWKIVN